MAPIEPESENNHQSKCSVCQQLVETKQFFQLQCHKLHCSLQNGGGELTAESSDLNLQNFPFEEGLEPWAIAGESSNALKEIYLENKFFILENHKIDTFIKRYNFPLTTLERLIKDISHYLTYIFKQQNNSFKVGVGVGYILINHEGELRYFIPHKNSSILNKPYMISKYSQLRRLVNILKNFDYVNHVKLERPSTKWQVELITNLNIFVYPTEFALGTASSLPDYLRFDKSIHALNTNRSNELYKDNLCAFRCLSYSLYGNCLKPSVYKLYRDWNKYTGRKFNKNPKLFKGLDYSLIHDFQNCFQINVFIFEKIKPNVVIPRYVSIEHHSRELNMNIYDNHLSLITDMEVYSTKYQCRKCSRLFNRSYNLKRHNKICFNKSKIMLQSGLFSLPKTIYEKLEQIGVYVPIKDRFFDFFVAYDLESALLKTKAVEESSKLVWLQRHQCISCAFCSNVEDFTEPYCIVEGDEDKLLAKMVQYLYKIQSKSVTLARQKWSYVFSKLEIIKQKYSSTSPTESNPENETDNKSIMLSHILKIETQFNAYINQLVCIGLNSSFYDLSILKNNLSKHLELCTDDSSYIIKKTNRYLCIANSKLKFLDVGNYMSPGTSYENFLKCFNITAKKSFFPYDYLDSFEKLQEKSFPPYNSFYSHLKGYNVLEREVKTWERAGEKGEKPKSGLENYADLHNLWKEKNMHSLECLLRHYSYFDVLPLRDAIERMLIFYKENNLDLFKIAVSAPGVSKYLLHNSTNKKFPLIQRGDMDLYKTIRTNLTGGPSIIFNRLLEKNTIINGTPIQTICGWDCNAMYLHSMTKSLPVGLYCRRFSPTFLPQTNTKYLSMFIWMDYISQKRDIKILHKLNNGNQEVQIGPYFLDGFCAELSSGYEYFGCYYHGHDCYLTKHVKNKQLLIDRNKRSFQRLEFLKSCGLKMEVIWECTYKNDILPHVGNLKDIYLPKFYSENKGKLTESQIITAIMRDKLFCAIEVDISVPEKWQGSYNQKDKPRNFFANFPPIFCNTDIPFSAIGEVMQNYILKNNLSTKTRRALVSGLSAKKIFLTSDLIKWYLNHGLVISKIYQLVEFTPSNCLQDYVNKITTARRSADNDASSSILANTFKLLGNSSYGQMIINKSKFTKIRYIQGRKELSFAVNNDNFISACELNDSYYELETRPSKIKINSCLISGFYVLNNAKLRLLEFYYDFLNYYVPSPLHKIAEIDTDAVYSSLPCETLEESIQNQTLKSEFEYRTKGQCGLIPNPNKAGDFLRDNNGSFIIRELLASDKNFLCRSCHPECSKFDSKTCGLFKLEQVGDYMLSLSSKTYILKNGGDFKISCKGLMKGNLQNPLEKFKDALFNQKIHSSINVGFSAKSNTIFTYQQERDGITFLYCKRKVLTDYISTEPLDIVLCPWKNTDQYIIHELSHVLSHSYLSDFVFESNVFRSIEQCLDYQNALYCNHLDLGEKILSFQSFDIESLKAIRENYKWLEYRDIVLEKILLSKFETNSDFKTVLQGTKLKKLILINSSDAYLGCGLDSSLAKVFNEDEFPGCNVLGVMLQKLRDAH